MENGKHPVYGATGVCGYTDSNDISDDSILIIKDGASVGTTYYASGYYSHIGTLNRLTAREGVNLRYSQVNSGRCFAYAALLVGNGNDLSHW